MEPNDIQIGGDHYRKEYQHWDLVCDTNMPYLLGCATKYIARHHGKNGIEDLRKSIHYVQKAEDRGVYMPTNKRWEKPLHYLLIFLGGTMTTEEVNIELTKKFCSQLPYKEAHITRLIVEGSYAEATRRIEELIEDTRRIEGPFEEHDATEPGAGYINQG